MVQEQVDNTLLKWTGTKGIVVPTGWYDIVLWNGEEHHEVYAEHGYFHFINDSYPSIPMEKVEWVRKHQ